MKIAVCERYGPPEVLIFQDLPKPSPKAGEVSIRTCAASVSAGDWRVRSRIMPRGFGLLSHLALGVGDLAGHDLPRVGEVPARHVLSPWSKCGSRGAGEGRRGRQPQENSNVRSAAEP